MSLAPLDSVLTCPVTKQKCEDRKCKYDIGSEAMVCVKALDMANKISAEGEKMDEAFDDENAKGEPALSLEEAQATVATKENPRVTKEIIESKIYQVRYIYDGTGTFCLVQMKNTFEVHGYSKPAHPNNYDREVGERYAYEDAFKKLWQLEGYLLCERLYGDQ